MDKSLALSDDQGASAFYSETFSRRSSGKTVAAVSRGGASRQCGSG